MPNESNICPKCGKTSLFQSSSFCDESINAHPLECTRQETYMCVNEDCRARFIRRYTPEFYNVKERSCIPNWMKKKFGRYVK